MKVDMDLMMILVPSCIFSLFLMLELGEAQVNFYSYMCSTSNDNYTTNSVYEVNLNQALTNLSSTQAASNRPNFYKLTVGSGSDQVYALYLCRGDVPPQVCKSCIDDASNLLPKQKCPNVKAAFILYLECMLRYTNLPNYSIGQDTSDEHWLTSYSGLNELNTTQFPQVWKEWTNGNGLELMDPSLRETFVSSEVLKCIHIGLLCVQVDPADRPTMSKVVLMLRSDTMILPRPGQPSFSFIERAKQEELKHFSNNVVTISNISGR